MGQCYALDAPTKHYLCCSTLLSFLAVLAFICMFCLHTGRPIMCLLPTELPIIHWCAIFSHISCFKSASICNQHSGFIPFVLALRSGRGGTLTR